MQLRLLARWWRARRERREAPRPLPADPVTAASGRHRRAGTAAPPAGQTAAPAAGQTAAALVPRQASPFGSPVMAERARDGRPAGDDPVRPGQARRGPGSGGRGTAAERVAVRTAPADRGAAAPAARPGVRESQPAGGSALPWYEVAHARRLAAGQRDCGPLEAVLHREWAPGEIPPPEVVRAIDRLAELPAYVQERLAAALDGVYVGPGGVPELDHMLRLRGVPLPSGRATWDSCAGAYGERKIIVGTRPSSAPDVMCHEIGHALDDIDGTGDVWQSDSPEFRAVYERCLPLLVSDFHKQQGSLGRREFFADAFSAIASRQRPALVDMLGGHTRTALEIMLFFNVRYGI